MLSGHSTSRYSLRQTLQISAISLFILLAISYLSYELRSFTNSLLLYLPIGISIVLVQWYGFRMLPVIYINGVAALLIWKSRNPLTNILLIATHEPLIAFVSKFLTDKIQQRPTWERFASADQLVLFTIFGIFIPVSLNSIYTYHYSFVNGDLEKVGLLLLSDFITTFCVSIPMLFFFQPAENGAIKRSSQIIFTYKGNYPLLEFWSVVVIFILLSFIVPFGQYWFIYGIITVVIGVRQGFESVVLLNTTLFLINYILPLIEDSTALITSTGSTQLINVHLGNATMLFVSSLVGRVVSDLRATERTLLHQKQEIEKANQQLNQTNQELDRFVYSVSHDLSAPLKSIQGLIHVSRMDMKEPQALSYLDMMEKSAKRLNDFINEVLDYSRTTRKELERQRINLEELMNELKEKLGIQEADKMKFELSLQSKSVFSDITLLKIALGNLLSNALKFQKKIPDHVPSILVTSFEQQGKLHIEVKDNGEGIQDIHLTRIFDMFYRATSNSPGSGLGLYIAREAIHKLGGDITVQTTYGEGSVFTVLLPIE